MKLSKAQRDKLVLNFWRVKQAHCGGQFFVKGTAGPPQSKFGSELGLEKNQSVEQVRIKLLRRVLRQYKVPLAKDFFLLTVPGLGPKFSRFFVILFVEESRTVLPLRKVLVRAPSP